VFLSSFTSATDTVVEAAATSRLVAAVMSVVGFLLLRLLFIMMIAIYLVYLLGKQL
jgi:hypothetical protein